MAISFVSCKYHPTAKLEENFYSIICSECGLVVVDRIIERNELCINNFHRSLVYQNSFEYYPPYVNDIKYLNTFISSYNVNDSLPHKFLKTIFEEANKIILKLNLNKDIMKNTFSTFKQICVFDEIRSCNKEAIIYSCIFIACKKESIPFSFKDVCATSTVTKKIIGKTFKKIMRRLIDKSNKLSVKQIIGEMCKKLGVGDDIINVSYIIVTKAIMLNIAANHSPISIVATAVLLAISSTGQKIDINETESRLSLSQDSLQETFDSFSLHLNNLLPSKI